MSEFIKNGDGWISGAFYRDGETVSLTEAAARYHVAPLGDALRRPGQADQAAALASSTRGSSAKPSAANDDKARKAADAKADDADV